MNEYIINWSNDSIKPPFTIQQRETIVDQCSLVLYGKGAPRYGEGLQENLIRMLEHFCSDNPPPQPTRGQQWYDSSSKLVMVYDGVTWISVSGVASSVSPPTEPTPGIIWFNTTAGTTNVWTGTSWVQLADSSSADALAQSLLDHIANASVHVDTAEKALLSSMTATNFDPNSLTYLDGLTGNIQTQLNGKVNRLGDTMAGFLSANADPVQDMHYTTKRYVDRAIFNAINNSSGASASSLYITVHEAYANTGGQAAFTLPQAYLPKATITAIVQGTKTFTVSGTAWFNSTHLVAGARVQLDGGTTNNGMYTVVSKAINGSNTNVVVSEAIPSATVAGHLSTNGIQVFVDGVHQASGDNYVETDETTITFTPALPEGLEIAVYMFTYGGGLNGASTRGLRGTYTKRIHALAGQTSFPIDLAVPTNSENLIVYIDGIRQIPGASYAYTRPTTTSFQLTQPLTATNIVDYEIVELLGDSFIHRETMIAPTPGSTSFVLATPYYHTNTASDPLNETISVTVQGVMQGDNEVSETTGNSILLASGVATGTLVDFMSYAIN